LKRRFTSLYTTYTERTAVAIGSDVFMRQQVVDWAQAWQPFLENLASGDGFSVTVTQAMVDKANTMLDSLTRIAQSTNDSDYADKIASERSTDAVDSLVGLTGKQVVEKLRIARGFTT
jgi:hypothetical protein